ncbi:AMP-binding protein [Azospirillum sp. B510]|uniref:AMP-binding protein n=1 Tax=Azospirillum sp. (strain B510) TaxID=137722 RepID=UPI0005A8F7DB|nr:AMP-binding protein [Azospirillum sp. B510]
MKGDDCVYSLNLSYWKGSWTEPVLEQTIGEALRSAAANWGPRCALIDGAPGIPTRRWSFSDLLTEAERVARAILARFSPGEHVAVWAANCPEWVMLEFGAALAGVTLVTVNPAFLPNELAYVLRHSRASGLFVQPEYRGRDMMAVVEAVRPGLPGLRDVIPLSDWAGFIASGSVDQALPPVAPDDIAQIQYTSGTTGFPKGAMLCHRGLVNNGRFYARTIGMGPDDVWVNPMPLFHTAGCGLTTLGALQTGGAQVLPHGFDPALILDLIESEGGSMVLCVPTMLIRLLEQAGSRRRDLSSWRMVTLGGAPVPPELIRRAEAELGLTVAIGFGQTEASPYITHTLPNDSVPDWRRSVGRPLPRTEVKVIDQATGKTVPFGVSGEICTRGYLTMKGYFDDPVATAAALDPDGWLHTGDLGSMDVHGYCRIHGRLKDMIIRGGENVFPREIEEILFTHPSVVDVAVVGLPDPEWGEVVAAFVRVKDDHRPSAEELDAFCRNHLASFKIPRRWTFLDRFPQTASGKIKKFELRANTLAAG